VHRLEAKVGGTFRMSFTNFTTGKSHAFSGEYRELKPGQRLQYTDVLDDPNLPGEILVTVDLNPVSVGTEIRIVPEGLPDAIPVEACYLLNGHYTFRSDAKIIDLDAIVARLALG
jgi:uncharacterized protein YndB with AHSA1/START domain